MSHFFRALTDGLFEVLESPIGPAATVLLIATLVLILRSPPGAR